MPRCLESCLRLHVALDPGGGQDLGVALKVDVHSVCHATMEGSRAVFDHITITGLFEEDRGGNTAADTIVFCRRRPWERGPLF